MINSLYSCTIGDTRIEYLLDASSGRVGLTMCPVERLKQVVRHREDLRGRPGIATLPQPGGPLPAWKLQSLVQLALVGDNTCDGHAQGRTMLNSPSTLALKFGEQEVTHNGAQTHVLTTLHSERGVRVVHDLWFGASDRAVRTRVTFHNDCPTVLSLTMLASFCLGRITPFDAADAPNRLQVHRFRSAWCAEGRLETRSIEQLHLERSWIGHGAFSERFGQVGTLPTRGFFPFVAVEDIQAEVLWGAQLQWAGSWQMEVYRRDDFVTLAGGLADREFGHWIKRIEPGGSFVSPTAQLACVAGTLDDLTDRLTQLQHAAAEDQPKVEHDLPIVFNEWCTTWGKPTHDRLIALADRLKTSPTRYLVIDAGWYRRSAEDDWSKSHGDWIPSPVAFPDGLQATAAAIRQRGLIPGIWFEMEDVGANSLAFSLTDHLLKRDAEPLTVAGRRFWDLNDPFAIDYLSEHVIDLLERCGFGYLKVDYNETLGIGTDHPDSLGEGLRQQVEGDYRFFQRIRERLPELVIENCASGGQRLEPSMMACCAMGLFSDAHELEQIPIIAANLQRLILPRQSLILAVLRTTDDRRRMTYCLAATFLGRMGLSGDVDMLSSNQWEAVLEAQRLYRRVSPIIKHGRSYRVGSISQSWQHPQGWQAVVRLADDSAEALVVVHTFALPFPEHLDITLPPGTWQIRQTFTSFAHVQLVDKQLLRIEGHGQTYAAGVVHLQAKR